jgi:hypothetical protein
MGSDGKGTAGVNHRQLPDFGFAETALLEGWDEIGEQVVVGSEFTIAKV